MEQSNLLRESNITLRDQLERAHRRLERLEKEITEADRQIQPLRGKFFSLLKN